MEIPRRLCVTIALSAVIVKILPEIILICLLSYLMYRVPVMINFIDILVKFLPPTLVDPRTSVTGQPRPIRIIQVCRGILRNGNPCVYRATQGDYCKHHMFQTDSNLLLEPPTNSVALPMASTPDR
jgi:hypothetical protein